MVKVRLVGFLLAAIAAVSGMVGMSGTAGAGAGAAYTAQLAGGQEVPPRTTPASGVATFQVSADGLSLAYTVTVRDITNVTMGHIHIAPPGTNGDIVLPLVPTVAPGGGPRSGVIGQGTATASQLTGPLQGKTIMDLVAEIDAGNAYVNIHTGSGASPATQQPGDIPPGEIRGQIVPAPASAAPTAAPSTMPTTGGGFAARRGSPLLPLALMVLLIGAGTMIARAPRLRR